MLFLGTEAFFAQSFFGTYFQNEHDAIQSLQDLQGFRFVQDIRNSVFLVAGRAIIRSIFVRVMSVGLGAEERPDRVELENDLFEP